MRSRSIYLDYAATTPVDPRVTEAMLPYFDSNFGNPSSIHQWGQDAQAAVEQSRSTIASILGCHPSEIIFTSCGSESDNLAMRGVAYRARMERGARHLLTTPVEHPAILNTASDLAENHGFELELLPIDSYGRVSPSDLEKSIRSDTAIVSMIYANNEIGSINPIHSLSRICRSKGVPFHTDAVQAASQLALNIDELGVDLMSIGAHKFYGPKGVGALFIRSGIRLAPVQTGGGHEFGLRAGTHNVPLIVGMAKALEIVINERSLHNRHFMQLRDKLLDSIPEQIPDSRVTGHPSERLPNHASFVFRGIDGNQLIAALDIAGFACSSSSACKTGSPEPSGVLAALGLPPDWSLGSLRVTVGRPTQPEHIDEFTRNLSDIIAHIRMMPR
jgi:cysteine desulfurase